MGQLVAPLALLLAITATASITQAARVPISGKTITDNGPPEPPQWPESYEISYDFIMPYVQSSQSSGLRYPVRVWYDGPGQRTRVDFYNGMDSTLMLPGAIYNVFPRITTRTCTVINTTVGPTVTTTATVSEGAASAARHLLQLSNEGAAPPPLPDLSEWDYAGSVTLNGTPTYLWQLSQRFGDKTATYTMHTSQRDGRPIKLYQLGVNLLTGSHFDEYIVEFSSFAPLRSPSAFELPRICKAAAPPPAAAAPGGAAGAAAQALAVMPVAAAAAPGGRAAALAARAGKQQHVQGAADEDSVVAENLRFIEQWNAQQQQLLQGGQQRSQQAADSPRLSANPFVRLTDAEWAATKAGLLRKPRALQSSRSASLRTFQRKLRDDELPAAIDWRGTGADGAVKDQASCGSCWAFATSGAMQGAWFLATGQSLSLSEQQIVDCAWDHQVNGCSGGWIESALDYVTQAGGATQEEEYPYIGQNGFCAENKTAKAAYFTGFQSVDSRDEKALMEALMHGPLGVSFDAVHPTFKYYSGGVYFRNDCHQDPDGLNHAVVIVGYGTTPSGTDYWIARNSWSKLWGLDGYFYMSRKNNDCGFTTDPVMAVVDDAKANALLTDAARQRIEAARAKAFTYA